LIFPFDLVFVSGIVELIQLKQPKVQEFQLQFLH